MQKQSLRHCFLNMQGQKLHRGMGSWNGSSKNRYGRIRAMLNRSGLPEEIRSGIWAESVSTATFYSNILASRVTKRFPQELLFGIKQKRMALII
jgi:hypothetical protein